MKLIESIDIDNLSASIHTDNNLRIGHAEDLSLYFTGIIDDAVIYDSEKNAAHFATRYNSGSGRESIEEIQKIYTGLKDKIEIKA